MTMPAKTRDTRLDVLRALALLMIFVDHVPGQPLENWTLRNFGFSDASEVFVLISGIAVALAYGRKYDMTNLTDLTRKAWRRAGTLFGAHLFSTFATIGVFGIFALAASRPFLMRQIDMWPALSDPQRGLFALITLGHQIGYNNILPMYMVLMLMVPAIIWAERRSPALLLAASIALWAIAGTWRIGPPRMLEPGIWFFNPLSWQLLFVVGYTGMRHIARGKTLAGNPILVAVALAYVFFACVWTVDNLGASNDLTFGLPYVLTGSDKTFLTGWRLLHVLAMTYVFISLPAISNLARLSPTNPLSVIGRHGLAIFVVGTLLSVAAQAAMMVAGNNVFFSLALIAAGIQTQIALAYVLDWLDARKPAFKRPNTPVGPSTALISG